MIDTILASMASRGAKKFVEMVTAKAPEAASELVKRQVVEHAIRNDYVPTMMQQAASGASAEAAIFHSSMAMAEKAGAHSVRAEKAVGFVVGIVPMRPKMRPRPRARNSLKTGIKALSRAGAPSSNGS